MPYFIMYLNRTPLFEWHVLTRLDLRMEPNKINVLERDWTTYPKFTNHYRLNTQHNWRGERSKFCYCFTLDLLMQNKCPCVNMI